MKKIITFLALCVLIPNLKAQSTGSKFDVRLGVGTSLLGTLDMMTTMIENELNLRINNHVTTSGSLGFAKSDYGVGEIASFIQLNSNIYLSPFKNTRRHDFRIGTGISWYSVSDVYQSYSVHQNNVLVYSEYEFENRKSFGFSFILENTYRFKGKYLIGVKLMTQPYLNGDINSGVLIKTGIKI